MEKVLDSKICSPESKLVKNQLGLYDLTITDETGTVIVNVKNITFNCAVAIIEESMYTRRAPRGE